MKRINESEIEMKKERRKMARDSKKEIDEEKSVWYIKWKNNQIKRNEETKRNKRGKKAKNG
jgi:hypothetical protein